MKIIDISALKPVTHEQEQVLRDWVKEGPSNVFMSPYEVRVAAGRVLRLLDQVRELHREEQRRSADRLREAVNELRELRGWEPLASEMGPALVELSVMRHGLCTCVTRCGDTLEDSGGVCKELPR